MPYAKFLYDSPGRLSERTVNHVTCLKAFRGTSEQRGLACYTPVPILGNEDSMVDQKKEDFMPQIEHYRAVLDDLQRQRDMLHLKIDEIDKAISSLHRLIPEEAKEELPTPSYATVSSAVTLRSGKYSGMSVRWAILNLLNVDATGPMGTGEIAEALLRGGITSAGKNFNANVSAVLSNMNNVRNEVQSGDTGWVVAPAGRQAWAHIRVKRAAQQQELISSNVQ